MGPNRMEEEEDRSVEGSEISIAEHEARYCNGDPEAEPDPLRAAAPVVVHRPDGTASRFFSVWNLETLQAITPLYSRIPAPILDNSADMQEWAEGHQQWLEAHTDVSRELHWQALEEMRRRIAEERAIAAKWVIRDAVRSCVLASARYLQAVTCICAHYTSGTLSVYAALDAIRWEREHFRFFVSQVHNRVNGFLGGLNICASRETSFASDPNPHLVTAGIHRREEAVWGLREDSRLQ